MKFLLIKVTFALLIIIIFLFLFFQDKTFALDLLNPIVIDTSNYKLTRQYSFDPETSWRPGIQFNTANQPFVLGSSALIVEMGSDKILFDKNSRERRPIASLTKIMTAILVLEHSDLTKKIKISAEAASIGENAMGISADEVYSIEELLDGLLLNSGNDAAYALAEGVAGSKPEFVKWMNIKAQELGLVDTVFTDPSGLDDGNISTAQDLVKLTRYALNHQKFRDIVKLKEKYLASNSHKDLFLENQTNLLSTYPGVYGVKTGYTEAAGLCLVTYASNDGHELIGVVLSSTDRKGDMILMLDHAFSSVGVAIEHNLL